MQEKYVELYKKLYEIKPNYGRTSIFLYNKISPILKELNVKKLLDYGCGKSELYLKLEEDLKIKVFRYDPAITGLEKLPNEKVDFVICTDVLQHVPFNEIYEVLEKIKEFSENCFFQINCIEHKTLLPNGEKANCTVLSKSCWLKILKAYFENIKILYEDEGTKVTFLTKKLK